LGTSDDGRRARSAGHEHLQQMEQRRGSVADRDDRAVQSRLPQRDRGSRAGRAPFAGQIWHPWVVEQAEDVVVLRQAG
jgi:hypothetical protein